MPSSNFQQGDDAIAPTSMPQSKIEEHTLFVRQHQKSEEQRLSQEIPEDPISDSGKSKEAEPVPSLSADLSEVMQPTERDVELEPDMIDAGIEAIKNMPQVPPEAVSVGIQPAKESVPIATQTPTNTKPQITKDQAEEVNKKPLIMQDASQSVLWLRYLWLRYYALLDKNNKK